LKSKVQNEVKSIEMADFWSLMSRMYNNRDQIRQHSNRIVELADTVDSFDNSENFEQSLKGQFEGTGLKKVFSNIQQEVNSILSYAHEIEPHLKNAHRVPSLSIVAAVLLSQMSIPSNNAALQLKALSWAIRNFAQDSNKLILNPSKKSIKASFGIDIGIEAARIKAYLEQNSSNYP